MNRCHPVGNLRLIATIALLGLLGAQGGCASERAVSGGQGVTVFEVQPPTPASLPPLRIGTAPPITTCEQLLERLQSGVDLAETRERPAFNAYTPCLSQALIRSATPAGPMRFDLSQAGRQIVDKLDLATVASSLAPRRPAEHYTFRDFSFASSRILPLSAELVSDSFRYRVDVLAAGDFRHDGQASLLILLSDRALAGSYDRSTLWVLQWAAGADRMHAIDAIELLRPPANR